jgi:hypothetical protein
MSGLDKSAAQPQSLARELLQFYDELTALNACSAFVMQALASALASGCGLDERSATGAVFCAQWLNDRTAEMELKLKHILSEVHRGSSEKVCRSP